jgi:thymidine phosphorylase
MVPADKKIYALRDASGTVPSIQLITASILSKKLAEGLDALILDVKFGSAAFMQTKAEARKLAKAMVALGKECGVNTRAILTDMNTPLGRTAGNWLEVRESVDCLENKSPSDLRRLVVDSAAHLLVQTRKAGSINTARALAENCLNSGEPRWKWDEMLAAQGTDMKAFNRKLALDATAKIVVEVKAEKAGFISKCDARVIGEVIRDLGGGRLTKESVIHYEVGVDQIAKSGERVERAGRLCRIHAMDSVQAKTAAIRLKTAFEISARKISVKPLVQEIIY